MEQSHPRVVLLEPDEQRRRVLERRLRAQSFEVESFAEPSQAANWALDNPPHALIADLWMPGVSGVQLCRLLKAEPATEHVPIILRAEGDAPKARFWAEQAGASAYVPKGRIGDLVRALNRAISEAPEVEAFFMQLAQTDVRERIALHLDQALFESVIASSVRALGTSESFYCLFDLFSQFVCRVSRYRWLAVRTMDDARLAIHCHPKTRESSVEAVRVLTGCDVQDFVLLEDEDAASDAVTCEPLLHDIHFGTTVIGQLAIQPLDGEDDVFKMTQLIAKELGGPLRIATLVEESRRLAHYDPLTGIMNRRAFVEHLGRDLEQANRLDTRLSFLLLDVDHFKAINDTFGHKSGDRVLSELGRLIKQAMPSAAAVARWGGEEFVIELPDTSLEAAQTLAESLRERVSQYEVQTDKGEEIPITISIGVAEHLREEPFDNLVERADQAMYAAKVAGRNRVQLATTEVHAIPNSLRAPSPVAQLS